jgi:hypothetical protein
MVMSRGYDDSNTTNADPRALCLVQTKKTLHLEMLHFRVPFKSKREVRPPA